MQNSVRKKSFLSHPRVFQVGAKKSFCRANENAGKWRYAIFANRKTSFNRDWSQLKLLSCNPLVPLVMILYMEIWPFYSPGRTQHLRLRNSFFWSSKIETIILINIIIRTMLSRVSFIEKTPFSMLVYIISSCNYFVVLYYRREPSKKDQEYYFKVKVNGEWLNNDAPKTYCGGMCSFRVSFTIIH